VCRQTVRYREGLEFLAAALQHAALNRLHVRLLEISLSSVRLHIAAGAFDKGYEALQEAIKYPMNEGNTWARDEIYCNEATLALENGDIPKAAAAFDCIGAPCSTFSVSRKGYYLALEIRLRLAQHADPQTITTLVSELEQTHCRMRGLGNQDFESYALFLGLCALGNRERATVLLREYVDRYRRVKWPLSERRLRELAKPIS
jgi:tetratricopeptide (TPR) repeat protein